MNEIKKLHIQQAILDGIKEYNRTYADKQQDLEKIVNDTADAVIKVVEND
jgi:hypothetical protein